MRSVVRSSLKSARSKRTTRTRATRPSEAARTEQRLANNDQSHCGGDGEEDVLVDALAKFMRPASQSTIRTRQTMGMGALSQKGVGGGGGLTQKQLAALASIEEHVEASGPAEESVLSKRRRSAPVFGFGAPGRTPRRSQARSGRGDGKEEPGVPVLPVGAMGGIDGHARAHTDSILKQKSLAKMPRIKDIRCVPCPGAFTVTGGGAVGVAHKGTAILVRLLRMQSHREGWRPAIHAAPAWPLLALVALLTPVALCRAPARPALLASCPPPPPPLPPPPSPLSSGHM